MAARKHDGPKMGHHTGNANRGRPSQLPPQAEARAHSQFARITQKYQHSWEFPGHPQGIPDDELEDVLAACTDFPANVRAIKFYQNGPTMTVFAEEAEE